MKSLTRMILLAGFILFAGNFETEAQKSEIPTISSKSSNWQKFEGYISYYYDSSQDKIYLEIKNIGEEILYVNSLPAGLGSNNIGLDRNQLGSTRIVRFDRIGPKIMMVQPNYRYRAISDNLDEVQAVEDGFAQSTIWGFKIVAEEKGSVLIDATAFLLRDAHGISRRLKQRNQGSFSLDASRSSFYLPRTKNFPENSEIEASISFKGAATGGDLRSVSPSSDAITVRMHHSFVKLPDDNYESRVFDPRSSMNPHSYMDYATPISENITKRFIRRHRLKKKDPSAAMSEAVEPIIYYLDRGTPEPILSALMDGARWWNQAFEAAGYKDAFQVKLLPKDADPMDVRYNLINWVHRSTRGWSYGSGVTDPRTGEIIKGHVSLGSLRVRQDFLIAVGLLSPYTDGTTVPPEMEQMALARLRQLSAHEVGHTLGLAHNYTSSINNRGSVMDYPHPMVKLTNGKIDLTDAYDTKIGEWDKVSITYGYRDFPKGTNEKEALNKILDDAYAIKGLTFLSDQDARPAGSAHPFAHLWDNGASAADELNRMMEIRKVAIDQLGETSIRIGEPMATLEEVLVPMYFFHRYQAEATTKVVGGLEYTYALRGDGQIPTKMVSPAAQQKAMDAILASLSPEALTLPESLISKIPPRPYGYRRSNEIIKLRTNLTFDPIGAAEASADMTVGFLFNASRASRLVEYHARDSKQPGLGNVLDQVIEATWKSGKKDDLSGEVGRTVDMVVLHKMMELSVEDKASNQARALTRLRIGSLHDWLNSKLSSEKNENQMAHYSYAMDEIKRFSADPDELRKFNTLSPPAGSPIGSGMACEF